jgi:hypothetical protein
MKNKPEFLTELTAVPLPDGVNWRVTRDLVFNDSNGAHIVVPTGFVTDFASIPPLARIAGYVLTVAIPVAHYRPAAWAVVAFGLFVVLISDYLNGDTQLNAPGALHDYGYRVARGRKLVWDFILYRAMTATDRPLWKKLLVAGNVVVFGWVAWWKSATVKERRRRAAIVATLKSHPKT